MRRARLTVFAMVVVGMVFTLTPAAAGGGCHDPEATESTASMVELRNACFTSTVTHVDPGQELAFVNRDDYVHNVIGLGARWGDADGMGRGETRRFTFGEAGIFPYACTLHPGMVGAVVVGGDELHAGNADSVSAVLSTGSARTAGVPSTGARQTDGDGSRLPETMLALALIGVLVGFVLRRRRGGSPAGA
jgi:MYXO-CTERM domain-containing protein